MNPPQDSIQDLTAEDPLIHRLVRSCGGLMNLRKIWRTAHGRPHNCAPAV